MFYHEYRKIDCIYHLELRQTVRSISEVRQTFKRKSCIITFLPLLFILFLLRDKNWHYQDVVLSGFQVWCIAGKHQIVAYLKHERKSILPLLFPNVCFLFLLLISHNTYIGKWWSLGLSVEIELGTDFLDFMFESMIDNCNTHMHWDFKNMQNSNIHVAQENIKILHVKT